LVRSSTSRSTSQILRAGRRKTMHMDHGLN
jgi:hypothetical protein